MPQRVDLRTLLIMLTALTLGLAWASYNLISVGPARNEDAIHALVWTVFATPLLLFMGWLLARRTELMLAAFCCFCLYFFTFFIAQRLESFFLDPGVATDHGLYFRLVLVIHGLGGVGFICWRAFHRARVGNSP